MIRKIFFLFFTVVLISVSGCSSSEDSGNFSFGKGKFRFKMSDSTGKALLSGVLEVKTYSQNGEITGTILITKKYVSDFPGYSSMSTEFSGEVSNTEKTVFINTNPKIADSNVFWNMKMKTNSLSGEWRYSVFRGNLTTGKIKITSY
ncbi:MAG: hypothetical protein JSS91_03175 [Bacteroidetes bacterium]|nr:hypothetical protein [Bacteroidota bacterium]